MRTFKNRHFIKRDYEATNLVACVAETAPGPQWEEVSDDVLVGLTQLWIEREVTYYGFL